MKTIVRYLSLICFILSLVSFSYGQNARKLWKEGKGWYEGGNYAEAIKKYSESIQLDSTNSKVYFDRAIGYEKLGKYSEALKDYNHLFASEPDNAEIFYNAGRCYYFLGELNQASGALTRCISIDIKNYEAQKLLIQAFIDLKYFTRAFSISENYIKSQGTPESYFIHGLICDSLNKLTDAELYYNKVISLDNKYEKAYISLVKVEMKLNKKDEAVNVCNKLISVNDNNINAYILKADIFHSKLDYPEAINDLSKALIIEPNSESLYLTRALYYKEFNQLQNAINDYTKAIKLNEKNVDAIYSRAKLLEEILNFELAKKDYLKIIELSDSLAVSNEYLTDTRNRLFELNKENNKPEISLNEPLPKGNSIIEIPGNSKDLKIKGLIKDESRIEYFKINEIEENLNETKEGNVFDIVFDVTKSNTLTLTAVDVYNNIQNITYHIRRTEVNPPVVTLITPYASDNGEIYLESENQYVYLEGKVEDESHIKSILIDEINASYSVSDLNPTFTANININNKNKIAVTVIDSFDNATVKEYFFNREGAIISANNPMGKTWMIFIENADYESFASLDGPGKDIVMMKSALANYEIHNFIQKKNMTKQELEKFFSIELRDLLIKYKVNSLLIWYAGHGKFVNESGYWIPIDAKRDDEFSYFNINNLKSSLSSYSKYLTHILIISDACECGPSFYLAMRGSENENKSCNDANFTRFKSSQVFSSAGYELAVDNSQFTKTFARVLENNTNACIPIDKIVSKVKEAVRNNNQQEPQFGRIQGLIDENGTFFFISKK